MSAESALTRRAVGGGLVGLAAAVALTTSGCDPSGGIDLPGLPEPQENPDEEQVATALQDERDMLERVRRVQHRHRRLADALDDTAAVHRAHVELLDGALDTGTDVGTRAADRVPSDPQQATAELVRLERSLADRHVSTSAACRSGSLARVVAVMSAAAAQQAVVLTPLATSSKEAG